MISISANSIKARFPHSCNIIQGRVVNRDIGGYSWGGLLMATEAAFSMMLVCQVTGHNIRHHCCYHPAITASSVPRSYRDSAAPHRTRICVGAYGGLCVLLGVATVISAIYVLSSLLLVSAPLVPVSP